MKTWVKLYTEINHDPKVGTLSWAQRGILSALFALCGEIDDLDADGNETGALDSTANLAWRLRCDAEELEAALAEFQAREIVYITEGIVYLTHYAARQARPPSAKREAVRQRVRDCREEKRERNDVTLPLPGQCNEDVTLLEKIREDTEKKDDAAGAAPPQAHHHHSPDGEDPDRAKVAQAWEQINPRRQITDVDREVLADLCDEYGPDEVLTALYACNEHSKPHLAYLRRILENRAHPARASPRARDSPEDDEEWDPTRIWWQDPVTGLWARGDESVGTREAPPTAAERTG